MALGLTSGASPSPILDIDPVVKRKIADVREQFIARLATIPRNPLCKGTLPDESPYEVDSEDESDE